jgi:ATP synthase mitochondrial F1 complex assembly factor 1
MKVGQGLASAIEKGEEVTEKAKDVVGATTKDAKAKAEEASAKAKQKGNQVRDPSSCPANTKPIRYVHRY